MRKLLFASVAAAALSVPAVAQSVNKSNDLQSPPQHQMSNPQSATPSRQTTGSESSKQQSQKLNDQQAQNSIDPSQLSSQQIRQIQQSLDKHGFKAGHADGKWGPETEKAVKDFQQKQNMQASGQLDQQTLQALGVNMTAQGPNTHSQGPSTTGQGSNEDLSPSQNTTPNATSGSGQNGSPNNQVNRH
jgi:peptidoglycan hydrolase-like protein with peptidoglycan-binding domain